MKRKREGKNIFHYSLRWERDREKRDKSFRKPNTQKYFTIQNKEVGREKRRESEIKERERGKEEIKNGGEREQKDKEN